MWEVGQRSRRLIVCRSSERRRKVRAKNWRKTCFSLEKISLHKIANRRMDTDFGNDHLVAHEFAIEVVLMVLRIRRSKRKVRTIRRADRKWSMSLSATAVRGDAGVWRQSIQRVVDKPQNNDPGVAASLGLWYRSLLSIEQSQRRA